MRMPGFTAERALSSALPVARAPRGAGRHPQSDGVTAQMEIGGGCGSPDDSCTCIGIVECLVMWLRGICRPGSWNCSPSGGYCTCDWQHKY
jgi:hypothetical protein